MRPGVCRFEQVVEFEPPLAVFLTLPLLAWLITGSIFLLKPGYEDAYHKPEIKTYPLQAGVTQPLKPRWSSVSSTPLKSRHPACPTSTHTGL